MKTVAVFVGLLAVGSASPRHLRRGEDDRVERLCSKPEHANHPDCKPARPAGLPAFCKEPEHFQHPDCNPRYPHNQNSTYPGTPFQFERVTVSNDMVPVTVQNTLDFKFTPNRVNAFDFWQNQLWISGTCHLGAKIFGACRLPINKIDRRPLNAAEDNPNRVPNNNNNNRDLQATAAPTNFLCNILNLSIDGLFLNLLGLAVVIPNLVVNVIGTDAGILGELLCGLLGPDLLGGAAGGVLPTADMVPLLNELLAPTTASPATPAIGTPVTPPAV